MLGERILQPERNRIYILDLLYVFNVEWGHILEFPFQDGFGYAVSEAAVVCFVKKLQRHSSSSDPINFAK
jgi:hypothetical protein